MGIFDKLFSSKSKEIPLVAPLSGEVVSIREVSDPTFGQEILGKGVAIRPTSNRVLAPCDGVIEMMFDTGHAVSLTSDTGAEILIHIGLETVTLKGKHFTIHAKNGERVRTGQLLIEFEREALIAEGFDIITPMVICNSDAFHTITPYINKTVSAGELVLSLEK